MSHFGWRLVIFMGWRQFMDLSTIVFDDFPGFVFRSRAVEDEKIIWEPWASVKWSFVVHRRNKKRTTLFQRFRGDDLSVETPPPEDAEDHPRRRVKIKWRSWLRSSAAPVATWGHCTRSRGGVSGTKPPNGSFLGMIRPPFRSLFQSFFGCSLGYS